MIALPDEPRWVEAHGIANAPRGWRRELAGGYALGDDTARLVVIVDAEGAAAAELAREVPQHTLLVTTDEQVAALRTTGRTPVRAIIHSLSPEVVLPDLDGAVELAADASLDHVPGPLAEELSNARPHPIFAAYVDGLAVAFAYAPWRSKRWFDVSVDTLPSARQLGLATIVASAMIRHERAAGREAVWGADEGNVASLRLAKRLGFVAVDEVWVAPP
ncbi:MAG: GNAT family N-acetyltransferase [Deltaproteobacteria bacterium]|nr:GNAT family N-acetyltransferase [Deltaproteobacteria bacterium]